MLNGRVSPERYGCLLWRLHRLHAALETAFERHTDLRFLYKGPIARTGALERDLARFPNHRRPAGLPATELLARAMNDWSGATPASLVGCLYVFEGSRMGSRILAPRLAAGFGLRRAAGNGLDYHLDGADRQPALWRQFKRSLDGAAFSPCDQDRIVDGARRTMNGLLRLFEDIGAVGFDDDAVRRPREAPPGPGETAHGR